MRKTLVSGTSGRILAALVIALALSVGWMGQPSTADACSTYVSGYYRSNGTYVSGYYRSCPNSTKTDNYSYPGNYNPNTGRITGGSSYYTPSYYTPSYYTPRYSTPRYSWR